MISNCGHDEKGKLKGGQAGDQTGGEWAVISWYNRPWNYVFRHPDAKVRSEIARLARAAANNNLIGYDQNQRHTFWQHLKASNYEPSQITIACEADCSAGVLAIVKAVGYLVNNSSLKNVNQDGYTGNQRAILKSAGFEVLTASKYLTSDKYLVAGDILLYEGHHTAINLDNGSASGASAPTPTPTPAPSAGSVPTNNVAKGQKWLNSNYGNLIKANYGALLEVDGSYGQKSRNGALCVWKDVVNRKYGYKLTLNNPNFYDSCKEAASKALMKKGSSGTLVYIIQFILAGKGFYSNSMDADFGTGTYNAVVAFQKSKGLSADGQVGKDTWYALFN